MSTEITRRQLASVIAALDERLGAEGLPDPNFYLSQDDARTLLELAKDRLAALPVVTYILMTYRKERGIWDHVGEYETYPIACDRAHTHLKSGHGDHVKIVKTEKMPT